jgi:hypothetical protein
MKKVRSINNEHPLLWTNGKTYKIRPYLRTIDNRYYEMTDDTSPNIFRHQLHLTFIKNNFNTYSFKYGK